MPEYYTAQQIRIFHDFINAQRNIQRNILRHTLRNAQRNILRRPMIEISSRRIDLPL